MGFECGFACGVLAMHVELLIYACFPCLREMERYAQMCREALSDADDLLRVEDGRDERSGASPSPKALQSPSSHDILMTEQRMEQFASFRDEQLYS